MVQPILFYALAGLTIAGALGILLARHPVYAVLSLVLMLFGLSGIFVLLEAVFVAVIQILVYAGAILVLFLFVVMLLDIAPETLLRTRSRTLTLAGTAAGLLFFWQMLRATASLRAGGLPAIMSSAGKPAGSSAAGTTSAVGELLFTTYALPFEAASLLLLAGVVGAIVLAKKKL